LLGRHAARKAAPFVEKEKIVKGLHHTSALSFDGAKSVV
jgi:hypothetical protein